MQTSIMIDVHFRSHNSVIKIQLYFSVKSDMDVHRCYMEHESDFTCVESGYYLEQRGTV